MFVNSHISKTGRKLLLLLSFAAIIFSIISYDAYLIQDQKERDDYYQKQSENEAKGLGTFAGPYCFPDKHPQFLSLNILLAGLIFATLIFSRTFLFSYFFSGVLVSRFVYWFYDTQRAVSSNELFEPQGLNYFFINATIFDILTLSILSVLFFWQISILLRMLIKTSQKENILP